MKKLTIGLCVAFASCLPAISGPQTEGEVREAMRWVYVHGVTEEIAHDRVGPEWEPLLLEMLLEQDLPRRDNVVYFLSHLGGPRAADALLAMLDAPPAGQAEPQEDRALLYAPRALGHIASRGEPRALDALLSMTADGSDGGPLFWASLAGDDPGSLLADLVEGALYGLAHARTPAARARLEAVRDGRIALPGQRRDLAGVARSALSLLQELKRIDARKACEAAGTTCPADTEPAAAALALDDAVADAHDGPHAGAHALDGPHADTDAYDGPHAGDAPSQNAPTTSGAAHLDPGTGPGRGPTTRTFDSQARVHDSPITYANHVDHPDPMTDARLDLVFDNSNLRAGRTDYGGDVACCITASRSGTGLTFGTPGDGLDIIDTGTERDIALTDPTARVKVVRAINQCGGAQPGIIGCAIWGGRGLILVRLGLADEGVTWLHEYGHNAGLDHSGDFFGIMFNGLHWANNGLSAYECNVFHAPTAGAAINVVDTGACTDLDVDEVQDGIDNCPVDWNSGQENGDGDSAGDSCDCAPSDGSVTRVADPAGDVGWQSKTLLSWNASVEAAGSNVYRGTIDTALNQDWSCLGADLSGGSYDDSSTPAAGTGYHYLVSGENVCGESGIGEDSNGTERSFAPCP